MLYGEMVGVLVISFRIRNSNFFISLRFVLASSLKPNMVTKAMFTHDRIWCTRCDIFKGSFSAGKLIFTGSIS